jgi:hypothetical protein
MQWEIPMAETAGMRVLIAFEPVPFKGAACSPTLPWPRSIPVKSGPGLTFEFKNIVFVSFLA